MKFRIKEEFSSDRQVLLRKNYYQQSSLNTARRFSFLKEGFPSVRIEVQRNCNGFLLADELIINDQAYAARSFSF